VKTWKLGMIALAALGGLAVAQKPNLIIGTGSTGGVFFFYGQSLASVLGKAGVANASSVQTGGSYDNILLLRDRTDPGSNTFYCALATTDSVLVTYNGSEPRFKEKKGDMQRVMFYMYPSFIHVVTTEKTGIKVLQDLKGKRVSTGQPGSSTENLALLVMEGAKVKADSFAKRERLPAAESAKALAEGTIDAYFWVGGIPTGSIVELSNTVARQGSKLLMVPVDPASTTAQVVLKRFPGIVSTATVPKSVYNTRVDAKGLNTGNVMTCPASMPEGLAYEIMKTLFDKTNLETLQTAVAAAKDTSLANTAKIYSPNGIPFHPGALKFLNEQGAIK
jgi:hypothetical protein